MKWVLPSDTRLPHITRIKTEIDSEWDDHNVEVELANNRFASLATLQGLKAVRIKAEQQGLGRTFLGHSEAIDHQRFHLELS